MILQLYAIKDLKVNEFQQPVSFQTNAQAIRAFGDLITKGETLMSNHKEDFQLFRLGAVDCESGAFLDNDVQLLSSGSEYLTHEQPSA